MNRRKEFWNIHEKKVVEVLNKELKAIFCEEKYLQGNKNY
jgi:hypothetical protein